jgi:folate-dependent tRNA-U54 methylase TrmFO/GidA|tara:strand:- start:153 stop:461 length:309 start_codon:yes stop_codon:yes gene_type:complete
MAKVYIPQVMDYNVRSAEKFGELTVMLPDNKQMILASGPLTFKLKQELKDFSDEDYLLLIGDPAIIAVCGAIAAKNNGGRFKVLKWDRNDKRYYDLEIDLRG